MVIPINNRLPVERGKLTIDVTYLFFYLFFSFYISRNLITGWDDIQYENNFFLPTRVNFQEFFIALQTIHKSFGIIQSVNRKNDLAAAVFCFYFIPECSDQQLFGSIPEFIIIYPNWEKV